MGKYSKAEFEEAKTALTSTLHKCEKIDESKKLGKSQQTLLDRRIKALRLALELIEKEMSETFGTEYKNGGS
jgi:DNA-binding transcriptional regulator YiaG